MSVVVIVARQPFVCPRQVSQFRCSWVGHESCTAILVASLILSVHLPHGGYHEEDYVIVSGIPGSSWRRAEQLAPRTSSLAAASTSSSLEVGSEDVQGLDSVDGYGLHGPDYRGGGGDEFTYENGHGFFGCVCHDA